MRSKPQSCDGCVIRDHGTDFSAIEGTGSLRTLIVGEASGQFEQRDQLPFRPFAPAGGVLERAFQRMGLNRNQFAITNILRCRPRNDWLSKSPWEYSAINQCRPNLKAAIAEFKPSVILPLGNIAMRETTGFSGVAEDKESITHLAGYCVPSSPDLSLKPIPVIAGFHPAFLRRGKMSYFGHLCRTIRRATEIAAGRDTAFQWNIDPEVDHVRLGYQTHPTTDEAMAFANYVLDNTQLPVSYDLETQESTSLDEDAREGFADTYIRLMQFAIGGAGAIAIPWEPGFEKACQAILHSPNTKCGHNVWLFDNKVLRAAGEREGIDLAPRGVIHDTLQMFHHWQPDLPAHLQFCAQFVSFPFPWKHLAGTNIEFYGCCDSDATLRLYFMLEKALKRDGIWDDEGVKCAG